MSTYSGFNAGKTPAKMKSSRTSKLLVCFAVPEGNHFAAMFTDHCFQVSTVGRSFRGMVFPDVHNLQQVTKRVIVTTAVTSSLHGIARFSH